MGIEDKKHQVSGHTPDIITLRPQDRSLSHFVYGPSVRKIPDKSLRFLILFGLVSSATVAASLIAEHFQPAGTGITPTAKADDLDCPVKKYVALGYGFADHPLTPNRKGIIDTVDFMVGPYQFGEVSLNVLDDPKDPKSKRTEIARGNMNVVGGDHAEAIFPIDPKLTLQTKSNVVGPRGTKAVQIRVSFLRDPLRNASDPTLPVEINTVVSCNQEGYAVGGRYGTEEDHRKAAKQAAVYPIGTKVDQRMQEILGRKIGLTPQGDNPQNNAKIFRDNLMDMIKHAQEARAKEKTDAEKSKPAATTTPPTQPPAKPSISAPPAAATATTGQAARVPEQLATKVAQLEQAYTGKDNELTRARAANAEQAKKTAELTAELEKLRAQQAKEATIPPPEQPIPQSPQKPAGEQQPAVRTDAATDIYKIPYLGGTLKAGVFMLDLPAQSVDWVSGTNTQRPLRFGVDLAGWLISLGLLLNRPGHLRTRSWNAIRWTDREIRYRFANRGVALPPARTYPGPFRV
ncbi:hypothetical protein HY384_01375 [Candidatus Daviesbacteria bacterium]|nr:hypothetical protein [Candidatus Daviesbacteria bacterium]